MTEQFTFRDFISYFSTGVILICCSFIVYWDELTSAMHELLHEQKFIEEFSGMFILTLIPVIYLIGHIVGAIDYSIMHRISRNILKLKDSKLKRFLAAFFCNYRLVVRIENQWNEKKKIWEVCNILQVRNNYRSSDYWYALNEFFKNALSIFIVSAIQLLVKGEIALFLVFILMYLLIYERAKLTGFIFIELIQNKYKYYLSK